jgi:outer membrane protein assembly factor BamC
MNRTLNQSLVAILLALAVAGCDSIPFIDTTPDYKSAGRSRPLEVPPDLTSASASDTYSVPGGSTTYSSYSQAQGEQAVEQEKILPSPDNVKLERAGSQRWLVVKAPPEKIWPVIREFWSELGFAVRVENPQTGVMETEWVDPSSLTKDEKGNYLDKFQGWLDKLNSLQTRQKFRTRIDRGPEQGTTEIYLSHRSISDSVDDGKERVLTSVGTFEQGYKLEKRTKQEQMRADAEDIDAELLRRLMVRLGVEEQSSRKVMAAVNNEIRATLSKNNDGSLSIGLKDPFDRAWRRVGLALDRIGFVVEDRDRSNGIFFVRYTDVGIDDAPAAKKDKGLMDKLKFWGDEEEKKKAEEEVVSAPRKKADEGVVDKLKFWEVKDKDKIPLEKLYRVKVESDDNTTTVRVTDKEGNPNTSTTANRIINLLYEQLK